VKSILDYELREKKSTEPFILHNIDGLSYLAPHFYNQHTLNQIQHYHQFNLSNYTTIIY